MKTCLRVLMVVLVFSSSGYARVRLLQAPVGGGPAEHCSGIAWNTLTQFALDFDNETPEQTCESASDGETGVLSANTTIVTPALVSPGSGGDALFVNGDSENIIFDNAGTYFASQYGELYFLMQLAGDNTEQDYIILIEEVGFQDYLRVRLNTAGTIGITWEDNNSGSVSITLTVDLDNHYGDWAQIHLKWDTTRCTQGDGNCADAGEDELAGRMRVDDNRDGDFNDGGAEDWTAWTLETSDIDLEAWVAEPTTDDFEFGIATATYTQNIYIDDVEITPSQPSW